jgi:hypothetical protein
MRSTAPSAPGSAQSSNLGGAAIGLTWRHARSRASGGRASRRILGGEIELIASAPAATPPDAAAALSAATTKQAQVQSHRTARREGEHRRRTS